MNDSSSDHPNAGARSRPPSTASPAVLAVARQVAEVLGTSVWAIGGSTLLYRIGLESDPHDLDIVTTPLQFDAIVARLTALCGPAERPPHDSYRSTHFARFTSPLGPAIDVMAGIRVAAGHETVEWTFDPRRIDFHGGLPFMLATDWLVLYRLFQRPVRVAQLTAYLAAHPSMRLTADDPIADSHPAG